MESGFLKDWITFTILKLNWERVFMIRVEGGARPGILLYLILLSLSVISFKIARYKMLSLSRFYKLALKFLNRL